MRKAYKNIEWLKKMGKTINPISGCNGYRGVRCYYCYAWRIALRSLRGKYGYPEDDPFRPAWHPEKLLQIRKRRDPIVWFYGSMCDHLDDGVKSAWRQESYATMKECDQHIFVTLTKQHYNLWKIAEDSPDGIIPPNVIVGLTVTDREQTVGIKELLKVKVPSHQRLLCNEPALEDVSDLIRLSDFAKIGWLIIGARSRQRTISNLPLVSYFRPEKEWVQRLVWTAKDPDLAVPTPVFLKPNLGNYVAEGWFPEKLEETPYERLAKP